MLKDYAKKRNFGVTPEPEPDPFVSTGGTLRFVIQKHDATRLHYDLRLEAEGVLKSWAVPKGPSLNPDDKRLAVMVEDHPLDYASFEGNIPKGEYGGGQVIVWDEGTYDLEFGGGEPAVLKGIEAGELKLDLHGHKLKGLWTLVRSKKTKDWLLIKHRDVYATEDDVLKQDKSVRTGRTIEDVLNGRAGKESGIPRKLAPMLSTEIEKPFSDPNWTFELKLDGIRALAAKENGTVRISSRNGREISMQFPSISSELAAIPSDNFVLDGEIVVCDASGTPSFQSLMDRFTVQGTLQIEKLDRTIHADFVAFDLLFMNGDDLRKKPFTARRKALEGLGLGSRSVKMIDVFPEEGELLFEEAAKLGFEGVIGKKNSSTYQDGKRTKDWVKVKGSHTEEFLICGFTEGQNARKSSFGALVLGREEDGAFKYFGNVGGGFSDTQLAEIRAMLDKRVTKSHPFAKKPDILKGPVTWVEPTLAAEVRFMTQTRDGRLRFPVFKRLRPDLALPETMAVRAAPTSGESEGVLDQLLEKKEELVLNVERHEIRVSSLSKQLWPDITKRDLLRYFAQVSEAMLPHLRDRPIAYVRFPDGIGGESFFQKHVDKGKPDFVETVSIWSSHNGRARDWILVNNLATLIWLGQLASLEIHPWYSRITPEEGGSTDFSTSDDTLDESLLNKPDFLVCDLDPNFHPKGSPYDPESFKKTVEVAMDLKKLLDGLKLRSFVKTSGKAGLHIYVPVKRLYDYDEIRAVAETIGQHLMRHRPSLVTMEWSTKKRPAKVFYDHNQNVRGKTLAVAYSPRPAPTATVSMPVRWEKLEKIDPLTMNIRTVPDMLLATGDCWAKILEERQDLPI